MNNGNLLQHPADISLRKRFVGLQEKEKNNMSTILEQYEKNKSFVLTLSYQNNTIDRG